MVKQLLRKIKKIEAKEKKGSYGVWRKEFCKKYSDSIGQLRKNTYNSLVETLTIKSESITCRKGCTHCCFHYVAVSLAQGIVIVDFLYKHRDLLRKFVDNTEKWHRKGYSVSNSIDLTRLKAVSSSMPIDLVIEKTRPMSEQYLDMKIQCPFLSNNKCFIYEVRPLACSNHYSGSPPHWCDPLTHHEPLIHHPVPNDEDLSGILRLGDPRLSLYELALPIMIHRLLTEGASSLMAEVAQFQS